MNYYKVINEEHTKYAGCRCEVKWNVREITNQEKANGYIVQHFKRRATPANIILEDEEYYEAWKVLDGKICMNEENDYDDAFAVCLCDKKMGSYLEELLEGMMSSINTAGQFDFSGEVYWISDSDELYSIVEGWTPTVKHAGDLKSSVRFVEIKERKPLFLRSFTHGWDFTNEEQIVRDVWDALNNAFPKNSVREQRIQDSISAIKDAKIRDRLQECFQSGRSVN